MEEKQYNAGNYAQKLDRPENPLYELMRGYVQAKEAFDEACHSLARASQVKAAAEKMLLEMSERVGQAVQQGVYDPTCPQPQPATPNVIGNGQYQGGLSPRY